MLLVAMSFSAAAQLARVPNTSLTNLPPVPPQLGYAINNAFAGVTFSLPVCLASPPGETNRLFVLEQAGNIVVITNLANPTRTVFMSLSVLSDGESGLLGLAFHPGFATNRYFFVFSSRQLTTTQGSGRHQVISRFQVTATNANVALANTELVLIQQLDSANNHNGGDLHFGADGYLYVSVGDEGAQYNGNRNAQIITNKFFSAILRLDVDKRAGNFLPNSNPASTTNYFIPADNPFVGKTNFNGQNFSATNVRTEFYSIGYRNPWRFSFDDATGWMYVGDVGQDNYEEVDVVTNGANCGWAYYEGVHLAKSLYSQSTILTNPPAGLVFPIQEYAHGSGTSQGNSVIGGVVYRGNRITQLYGAYIFSDYNSGNVWMLRYDGSNTVPFQRIAGASSPAAIGTDPRNGDVLFCQHGNSQIGRLDYNATQTGASLPPTLADTGAFTNLTTLAPAAGIVPYDLNVPFWSDNAVKSRWFSVPNTNLAITFNATGNWSFPTGSVWIKHFEIELTNGVTASRKRLETRFIIRNTNGIYGITYRWDSLTNATLVPEAGTNETLVINDGGNLRPQIWHYPSRSECLACHTPVGGYALGFNTAQLNRSQTYGALTTNQISALNAAGYFTPLVTDNPATLLTLASPTNTAFSLEFRVRSFLAANCVQCHQPGGPAGRAAWDARIITPTLLAGLITNAPVNNFGSTNNFIIAPRSPTNSVLLTRLGARDLAALPSIQMPPLASNLTNAQATQLITDWINSLPTDGSPAPPQFTLTARASNALVLRGGNGWPGKNFLVRTTASLFTPRSNWPVAMTNTFDAGGNFNFTNPLNLAVPRIFYLLQVP